MRVNHKNGLNQGFVGVKGELNVSSATRKVTAKASTLKVSAAALRALATVPTAERDTVAGIANDLALLDDRAIRAMIWDGHIALATGEVEAIRPGVADDAAVSAWRKARGLTAPAVPSPAAR